MGAGGVIMDPLTHSLAGDHFTAKVVFDENNKILRSEFKF